MVATTSVLARHVGLNQNAAFADVIHVETGDVMSIEDTYGIVRRKGASRGAEASVEESHLVTSPFNSEALTQLNTQHLVSDTRGFMAV